jgi:hypothetical protein
LTQVPLRRHAVEPYHKAPRQATVVALPTASDQASGADEESRDGLLLETGVTYNKLRLHRMGYFEQLLKNSDEIPDSIRPLLRMSREHIDGQSSDQIP